MLHVFITQKESIMKVKNLHRGLIAMIAMAH